MGIFHKELGDAFDKANSQEWGECIKILNNHLNQRVISEEKNSLMLLLEKIKQYEGHLNGAIEDAREQKPGAGQKNWLCYGCYPIS
jgi:hypothetical protein